MAVTEQELRPQSSNSKTLQKVLLFHCQHQRMSNSLLAQSLALVVSSVALAKVLDGLLLLLLARSASSWSLGFLLHHPRRPSLPANAVFLGTEHRCRRRLTSGLEESA